jgi:seryl-tRNA synthetase
MLDLALVRSEPARVKATLARRGVPPTAVDAVVRLDAHWTERQEVREALRLRRRRIAEEVARAKGTVPFPSNLAELEALGRTVGDELSEVERDMSNLEARRLAALLSLPNLPATDVPEAQIEPAAEAAGHPAVPGDAAPPWSKPFAPLAHWDLLELLGLAGPCGTPGLSRGFLVWRASGARLVRALVNFMLDVHTREFGYEEIRAPALASRAQLTASAHLPLLEDKMYHLQPAPAAAQPAPAAAHPAPAAAQLAPTAEAAGHLDPRETDFFLAPRAEPHLAGLYAGQVLDAAALPVRLVSAGPAFRRESHGGGAAGRGLLRLHEFDTVELYVFAAPDQAEEELDRAVRAAETILARLEVPFRRTLRPAPALSHAAAKTIALDVWAAGQQGTVPFRLSGGWLAVGSISTFTDYQARRTNTRLRDAHGHTRFVHTVGGAAVALPRLIAALLENQQQADGSVRLPPALVSYFGEARLTASQRRSRSALARG